MSETLREKQTRFLWMVADLLIWARAHGYALTLGDGYRDPRVFGQVGERKGYGEPSSCHKLRLAVDLNLFRDADGDGDMDYSALTESHRPLGEYWESLGGSWGGRFPKGDGNHYSLEHEGHR